MCLSLVNSPEIPGKILNKTWPRYQKLKRQQNQEDVFPPEKLIKIAIFHVQVGLICFSDCWFMSQCDGVNPRNQQLTGGYHLKIGLK